MPKYNNDPRDVPEAGRYNHFAGDGTVRARHTSRARTRDTLPRPALARAFDPRARSSAGPMLSAPRLVAPRLVAARPALARRGRALISRAPRRSPGRSAGAYGERRGASGGWANEFGDEYESIDADDGWFEPPRGPPRRGRPPRGDRGAPPRGGRFDDRANRGGGRRRDFDDRGRRGGPPAARGDDWVEVRAPSASHRAVTPSRRRDANARPSLSRRARTRPRVRTREGTANLNPLKLK